MGRPSSSPSRRWAILAAIAVVALVAGALVAGALLVRLTRDTPHPSGRDDTAPAASPRPTSPAGATSPMGEAAGIPVGFADDEPGSVAAAIAYATASQRWLHFTDDEIEAAIAEIATPVAAPRLAEDVVADVSMARDQLARSSGRIWWLVRPLAWRASIPLVVMSALLLRVEVLVQRFGDQGGQRLLGVHGVVLQALDQVNGQVHVELLDLVHRHARMLAT